MIKHLEKTTKLASKHSGFLKAEIPLDIWVFNLALCCWRNSLCHPCLLCSRWCPCTSTMIFCCLYHSPCRWSHLPWPCIKRKEVHTLLLCSFNSPEQRGKKCLARTKKWLVGTCEYLQQQRVRLPHSKEIHYKLFVRNVYTLVLQINSLCPKSAKILLTELNQ